MRRLLALAREWRLVAAALVAGAIVHIVVTLYGAQIGQTRAYAALVGPLPINQVVFAPAVDAEGSLLPFQAPDSLYAYCRYDATTARIRLKAGLPEAGWTLSLFTARGENFYHVPGTDAQTTNVELTLVPPGNVFVDGGQSMPASGPVIPQVRLPDPRGIAILRAPIKGLAYRRLTDEMRGAFSCEAMR